MLKHFESAQHDQTGLQSNDKMMVAQFSNYQWQKKTNHNDKSPLPCQGCSSLQQDPQGAKDQSIQCSAWGKICSHSKNIANHFTIVCHKRNDTVNALIAHVEY